MVNLIEEIVKNKDLSKAHIVIKSYKPLLITAINRNYNKPKLYDELLQEGALEICEAILDFDEGKNIPFSGYLKSRINYYYLGKNNEKNDFISLDVELGDESFNLLDIIPDDINIQDDFERKEDVLILYKGLESLTKRQRDIVKDFYLKDISLKEIAEKYGISYRTAVNTKVKGLRKLKKFLMDSGNF